MIEIDIRLPLAAFELEISAKLKSGVTAVVGPSGAGKTSLLEVIAGIRRGARGFISIGGEAILDSSRKISLPPERRRIGYVPQDAGLFPHLSAGRNIEFATGSREAALEAAEKLEVSHLLDQYPSQLSGGERHRVSLARALAMNPRMLLLDEPLAALDQPLRERILVHLKKIRDTARIPILYVTHHGAEALALSSETIVIEKGRVLEHGSSTVVLHRRSVAGETAILNVLEVEEAEGGGDGVRRVHTGEGTVLLLPSDQLEGARFPLTIQISGDEIVLFTERPRSISARNILEGPIESIERERGFADITVGTPTRLFIRVTDAAVKALSLEIGTNVWLAIRSRSIRIIG